MCRLYLYTTLKIEEILDVVYHNQLDNAPGKDSANKRLSALLDKQPRWLRPVNEQDFILRCDQLSLSPVRSNPHVEWPTSRPHSSSAPPPYLYNSSTPIKDERDTYSANLEVPPSATWTHAENSPSWPAMMADNEGAGPSSFAGAGQMYGRSASADFSAGIPMLQRHATRQSTSSNRSTTSLHQILDKYPDSYVQLVRRLVKRYTAPIGYRGRSTSPAFEAVFNQPSWLHDPDAAPHYNTRPFPLPGDFLKLDLHVSQQLHCFDGSEEHQKRWCMCAAQREMDHALWTTPHGLTDLAHRLLTEGPREIRDLERRDDFGNTMLHLLAARGCYEALFRHLGQNYVSRIVNCKNSAGQTFLHVLSLDQGLHFNVLCDLLDVLVETQYPDGQRYDFSAKDYYGRTFFHVLLAAGFPDQLMQPLFNRFRNVISTNRDAFDIVPLPQSETSSRPSSSRAQGEPMDLDEPLSDIPFYNDNSDPAIAKEIRLIQLVYHAQSHPKAEDAEGRNGLHCLAAATLSRTSVVMKNSSPRPSPPRRKRKSEHPGELLDSSSDRLTFRLQLTSGLLESGVDPNHYDSSGNTPLMAFVAQLPEDDDYQTGPQIIQLLLEKGANIHARNRAGETALHIAVRCGRKLAVKALLDQQANVHARDAAGRSLLTLADIKMESSSEEDPSEYAHYEACRAYLSGGKGHAVQEPTILQEWGYNTQSHLFGVAP
jgi:ankyrin repeat protein